MPADRSTPTSRRAYGATSGPHSPVPQPASSTSRLFDGARPESSSIAATSAGARYDSFASFDSKLAAKLSKVASTNPSDARAGHVPAGAGRQHVPRNRIVRLFREPFLEDLDRLVDLAERAVRQRQQPARLPVLRPERDHLAEARDGFLACRFNPLSRMPRLV